MRKSTQAGKPPHLAWKKGFVINLQVWRILTAPEAQKMLKIRYSSALPYAETEAKSGLLTYGQTGNPNQKRNIATCFLASYHRN